MIFKSKIIKISISFLFIFLFVFCTIKIIKRNEENNINVKYVNKIESHLYQKIQVYDYNNNQYEINELIFTKQNIVEEIFYYYNDKFNYLVDSIESNKEDKKIDVIINLNENSKEINVNDFKLIKLTYKQLNIDNLIINYRNNKTII